MNNLRDDHKNTLSWDDPHLKIILDVQSVSVYTINKKIKIVYLEDEDREGGRRRR